MRDQEKEKIKEWGFEVEDWQSPDRSVGISNGWVILIDEYNTSFEIDFEEARAAIEEDDKPYFLKIMTECKE